MIKKLFEIEYVSKETCQESPSEPPKESSDVSFKLPCYIDFEGHPINYLQDGLKQGFTGNLTKFSESLKRNATYTKVTKINKLVMFHAEFALIINSQDI